MDLDAALGQLARDAHAPLDVAELALWLARDEYTDLDVEAYLSELAGMAHEVRDSLRGSLENRVARLCRYLFHDMGFRGNQQDYYDPCNSYLNQVLDRRSGIPITLSAVVMAVGRRAGLAIDGVGLPGHFVVKATAGASEIFFDPFHGGRRLTPADCESLVRRVTGASFTATPERLQAMPLHPLIVRMLTNLKAAYLGREDFPRAARIIGRLVQLSPQDVLQRRDLGITLLHAGRAGAAVDHLTAYLASVPDGPDAEAVREVLNQAYKDVGKWN
jgi:regulator of sirC expression with transglutaminase-like and TPR domain